MDTRRVISAPDWQIEVDELPIGESSTGFSLEVFVDVITPFGATTTKTIQVFSLPPKNKTLIVNRKLDEAVTSDPETAASLFAIGNILPSAGPQPAGAIGQSLGMAKYQTSRGRGTYEYTSVEHEDELLANQVLSTFAGRQPQNHPPPFGDERVVDTCDSAYCDMIWLLCIHRQGKDILKFMCCDAPNPKTQCENPPCWFHGHRCPVEKVSAVTVGEAVEAYWPDDDQWLPAEISAILEDGNISITWEDGSLSDVPADYASYAMMPPFERATKKAEATLAEAEAVRAKKEAERQTSQLITRAAVLRDTICKQVIVQLTTGAPPMRFVTPGFVLYIGRTRNMSQVSPVFVFPPKFAVPPTAGNTPSPGSNVTAFSFIFVEYTKNIYGWSDSAPPGNQTRIITLIVMRASTIEIEVSKETFPIKVFADQTLFSSGLLTFMFQTRPTPAKKRLVKKSANADQMDTIAKVRQEIESKSSLAPPPGYLNLPALPPPSSPPSPGTTLLSLPPPMMALPAPGMSQFAPGVSGPGMLPMLKAGTPMGALPPPPKYSQPPGQLPGLPGMPGMPGLPGLPPLPTLKAANPALGALPPPPKYPRARSNSSGPAALNAPPPPPLGGRTMSNPSIQSALRAAGEGAALPPPPTGTDRQEPKPQIPGLVTEASHQAAPPDDVDEAEEAAGTRRLMSEAKHGMAPQNPPPLPPLSGPPPPKNRTPTGGMTPTGNMTPQSRTPAGSTYNTPRTPPPPSGGTPGSAYLPPALPGEMPMMPAAPQGVTRGVVHRGDAPGFIPAPFKGPPPKGPPGTVAKGAGAKGGVPAPPPPPPPPPREDDPTFVRRVRLAYIDRAAKSHAKILQEEGQDVGWVAPEWVYQVTLMSPYIASGASIACQVVLNLAYSTKFQRVEDSIEGSSIGPTPAFSGFV
eukprot:g23479.t1